jgi:hypothetical protein
VDPRLLADHLETLALTSLLLGWVVFVLCRNKQQVPRFKCRALKEASRNPCVGRLPMVTLVRFVYFSLLLAFHIDVEVNDPIAASHRRCNGVRGVWADSTGLVDAVRCASIFISHYEN